MISKDISKKIIKNSLLPLFVFLVSFFVMPIDETYAVCVANNPTVVVTPVSDSGIEGATIAYNVNIKNNDTDCADESFNLSFTDPAGTGNWLSSFSETTVTLADGAEKDITLNVTSEVETGLSVATYNFFVTATAVSDGTKSSADSANYVITSLACIERDPIVTITPSSASASPGEEKTYTLNIQNNDSSTCSNRTFDLSLGGLVSCSLEGWSNDLAADTGSLAAQGTYISNLKITSCPSLVNNSYTFEVTASQGLNMHSDSADYVIATEICDGVGNDDGDIYVNDCDDPDCLGSAYCCGNGTKENQETCDSSATPTGCGPTEQCASCSICIDTINDSECAIDYDDCNCDDSDGCESYLPTDINNCGSCGNVCDFRCENGVCLLPIGGLVPCGRMADNPDTIWNEVESCKICHIIPLMNNIIDYLIAIVGLITVLFIIIAGIISTTSAGSANSLILAKNAVTKSLYGFVFVLIAWVTVNVGMVVFGFDDPMGDGSWAKFDCELNVVPEDTTYCGDAIVQETGNGDGIMETCERKESKITYFSRTGTEDAEAWVTSVFSCNPITCTAGCIGDPQKGKIGMGCYGIELADGTSGPSCQKGKLVCDEISDTVKCRDVFSDADFKMAGFSCTEQWDYCCKGDFNIGGVSYDIVRPSIIGVFYCDNVCKNLGKICVGVGMDTVTCSVTVHNNGWACANLGNTATATCQAGFRRGSGFCGDGEDSMGWIDTKCYCK
ncbi:hypothetical protein K0B03_03735 [Patescibacteria group bacterium]|nr:hypothetical protein [Patescibacteria group bacterium]